VKRKSPVNSRRPNQPCTPVGGAHECCNAVTSTNLHQKHNRSNDVVRVDRQEVKAGKDLGPFVQFHDAKKLIAQGKMRLRKGLGNG